jgi:hypothetical protein
MRGTVIYAFCFVWVWNLVSHCKGTTYGEGVREPRAEANNGTQEDRNVRSWRILHYAEVHHSYPSQNSVIMVISGWKRWAGYVALMGDVRKIQAGILHMCNFEKLSRTGCCLRKAAGITYSECVCMSACVRARARVCVCVCVCVWRQLLSAHSACAVLYCHLCPVRLYHIIPHTP